MPYNFNTKETRSFINKEIDRLWANSKAKKILSEGKGVQIKIPPRLLSPLGEAGSQAAKKPPYFILRLRKNKDLRKLSNNNRRLNAFSIKEVSDSFLGAGSQGGVRKMTASYRYVGNRESELQWWPRIKPKAGKVCKEYAENRQSASFDLLKRVMPANKIYEVESKTTQKIMVMPFVSGQNLKDYLEFYQIIAQDLFGKKAKECGEASPEFQILYGVNIEKKRYEITDLGKQLLQQLTMQVEELYQAQYDIEAIKPTDINIDFEKIRSSQNEISQEHIRINRPEDLAIKPKVKIEDKVKLILILFEKLFSLHKQNLVHCDIKPANIMLDLEKMVEGKLTEAVNFVDWDFIGQKGSSTWEVGTPLYQPTEVFLPSCFSREGLQPSRDVYSLAVLAIEWILGETLFYQTINWKWQVDKRVKLHQREELLRLKPSQKLKKEVEDQRKLFIIELKKQNDSLIQVLREKHGDHLEKKFIDYLEQCLSIDPKKRPIRLYKEPLNPVPAMIGANPHVLFKANPSVPKVSQTEHLAKKLALYVTKTTVLSSLVVASSIALGAGLLFLGLSPLITLAVGLTLALVGSMMVGGLMPLLAVHSRSRREKQKEPALIVDNPPIGSITQGF